MKILFLFGSLRDGSTNAAVLRTAQASPRATSKPGFTTLRTVLTYTGCEVVDACIHLGVPRDAIEDGIVIDSTIRAGIGLGPAHPA